MHTAYAFILKHISFSSAWKCANIKLAPHTVCAMAIFSYFVWHKQTTTAWKKAKMKFVNTVLRKTSIIQMTFNVEIAFIYYGFFFRHLVKTHLCGVLSAQNFNVWQKKNSWILIVFVQPFHCIRSKCDLGKVSIKMYIPCWS